MTDPATSRTWPQPVDGATRLHLIVGDPVCQVKSPAGMTAGFARSGLNAVLLPVHVTAPHLAAFLAGADTMVNLDGIVVTLPHKFACSGHCASMSDPAALLSAVNVMRRQPGGAWHGDMLDGLGFVAAALSAGAALTGSRALLVGAGGAGSAIALALLDAGVAQLDIHDIDGARADTLAGKLSLHGSVSRVAAPRPEAYGVLGNGSPAGMGGFDPIPLDTGRIRPGTFVGCVVTDPVVTPLIQAARVKGCRAVTGEQICIG